MPELTPNAPRIGPARYTRRTPHPRTLVFRRNRGSFRWAATLATFCSLVCLPAMAAMA